MFVEMNLFQFFDLGEPCPETSWGRMLLIINDLIFKFTFF
jgi:ABC-type dipeptide/oligopeptide/nickel transport system permease subunit